MYSINTPISSAVLLSGHAHLSKPSVHISTSKMTDLKKILTKVQAPCQERRNYSNLSSCNQLLSPLPSASRALEWLLVTITIPASVLYSYNDLEACSR